MSLRWFFGLLLAGILLWIPASSVAQDTNVTVHVVQRGETLFRISQQYSVSVEAIAAFNNIADPTNIQVGQRLLIPLAETVRPDMPATHVVQPGETLKSIASRYNVSVEDLAALNNLVDIDTIYVGQVLNLIVVPTTEPVPTATTEATMVASVPDAPIENTESAPFLYTVQGGDTLFRIATRFGLTVNDLARANNVSDPTLIYSGQQLIIPGLKAPELALDLPSAIVNFQVEPLIFVEGETGRFRFTTTEPMTVGGTFLDRVLTVASDQAGTVDTILVGVPVFTEAGIYPLSLTLTNNAGEITPLNLNIQVLAGGYSRETITIASNRTDLLDPILEASEQGVLQGIMGNFTPTRYFDGPMSLPAAASISSPFGRKRSYNGGPFDRFHAGTDFAGAPGTPVLASAPGYVVFAGQLDVRGNATIIDHGWGVYTGYWHQTQQYVNVGDYVNTEQVIGTIGSTGRVTGPHLHWELWVNGVPVDPMQWVQESFS
ncbi:MAG: LysM peptidoglycan-binding domain-containing protein [Chloroflexi bacterium]|nr:LysM peptidoglycan-binding domain-containing protein [Chloroflexota bacterium]MCC6891236.1 LysM peptidoglycan-binding domain-containing protein [Anaerolineae bacterium]